MSTTDTETCRDAVDRTVTADLDLTRERGIVERALTAIPEAEPRAAVEAAFGFVPSDAELELVTTVAARPPAPGPAAELMAKTLALRVALEAEVSSVLDGADGTRLGQAAGRLPAIEREVATLIRVIRASAPLVQGADRVMLAGLERWIRGPADRLAAAVLLAPRLAIAPAGPTSSPSVRLAAALRDALASIVDCGAEGDDGAARLAAEAAYRIVAERLQTHQDAAIASGAASDEIQHAKRELFAAFLRLRNARRETPDGAGGEAREADGETLERLIEESAAADSAAANRMARHTPTAEEAALEALRRPESRPTRRASRSPRLQGRRKALLATIVALLAVACAGVYASRLGGRERRPTATVDDIGGGPLVHSVLAIGPMLYAEVDGFAWSALDQAARTARVEGLATRAAARGFETLYVTDEHRKDLARWTRAKGVRLLDDGR